jgi:hypothetical protein
MTWGPSLQRRWKVRPPRMVASCRPSTGEEFSTRTSRAGASLLKLLCQLQSHHLCIMHWHRHLPLGCRRHQLHHFGHCHQRPWVVSCLQHLLAGRCLHLRARGFGACPTTPGLAPHNTTGFPALFNFLMMVSASTKPDTLTFPCSVSMLLSYTHADQSKRIFSLLD